MLVRYFALLAVLLLPVAIATGCGSDDSPSKDAKAKSASSADKSEEDENSDEAADKVAMAAGVKALDEASASADSILAQIKD